MYYSKVKPLYAAFLHSVKLSGYRMRIKFDKESLAVDQNNYLTKTINVYTVYDLDDWSRNPTNNFKFRNCLFGATIIGKNSDKEKYGITFNRADSWSFKDKTARNVMIFCVDNSSSPHADNCKNTFLMLSEGPTFGINGSYG